MYFKTVISDLNNTLKFTTQNPKNELIQKIVNEHFLKSTNITFDPINFIQDGEKQPKMPQIFSNTQDIKALKATGTTFLKHVTDGMTM